MNNLQVIRVIKIFKIYIENANKDYYYFFFLENQQLFLRFIKKYRD